MSPFDFFFTFYGLLLALSVAIVATGYTKMLKLAPKGAMGWLTPMLAIFMLLDIASFWWWAWESMRGVSFSYGLLVMGLFIAMTYLVAAAFIFPEDGETRWTSLDEHYDARKKVVFGGMIISNTTMFVAVLFINNSDPFSEANLGVTISWGLYIVLFLVCMFVRSHKWNVGLLGFCIVTHLLGAMLALDGTAVPAVTPGA